MGLNSAATRRWLDYSPPSGGLPEGGADAPVPAALRRRRLALSASASRRSRCSACVSRGLAGFRGFSGGFCDIPAYTMASAGMGLPMPGGFRYADASQAGCCRSSVVERILGKAEVGSSILPGGTIFLDKC